MATLPPPEIPTNIISFATVEDGSLTKIYTGEAEPPGIKIKETSPIEYLEGVVDVVQHATNHIAWKNKVYEREGYEILHVGFRDIMHPAGYDKKGLPDFMRYSPKFESESLQRLVAAEYAREELLRLGEEEVKQGNEGEEKRTVNVHEYPHNYGLNKHVMARYLSKAFQFNIEQLENLVPHQSDNEKKLFEALKKWGENTQVIYDSRGDFWRKQLLDKPTRFAMTKKPLLPHSKRTR